MNSIYLDYASTTPIAPEVYIEMVRCLKNDNNLFGNSSSNHEYGWNANNTIQHARKHIANIINSNVIKLEILQIVLADCLILTILFLHQD